MSAGDVVCTGWLIKSPPEKKLKRYAWRKRWFVLRQGRMCGNPDVLEYYRSRSSRKPIRSIDLSDCQVQMLAQVQPVRREFQHQHLFLVRTSSRVFYLVAQTQEEMDCWVRSIAQICHFHLSNGTSGDATPLLSDSVESVSHSPSSHQPSPTISRLADPEFPSNGHVTDQGRSRSESGLPLDYLFLSQCETGRASFSRCNSCSNSEKSLEQSSSDNTFEDVFPSPLCPTAMFSPFPPLGTAASGSASPRALHFAPEVFRFDGSSPGLALDCAPPRPPKPRHFSETGPRRISLPGLHHARTAEFESSSVRSWNKRLSLNLPHLNAVHSPVWTDYSEDSYVPMNSGGSPPASPLDCASDGYIPMSPTVVRLLVSNGSSDPSPPGAQSCRPSDSLDPPPVNRDLKPRRRARPPPLDLRGLSTIREYPTHLLLTRTLTEPRQPAGEPRPGDHDHSCFPKDSRQLFFPPNENMVLPWPRSSNLDYLSLDFNTASPSPVQKKPLLADEDRVDYVQVDEKKTQALQSTKMEWKDVRQSQV